MENTQEQMLKTELVELFQRHVPLPVLGLNVLFSGLLVGLLWDVADHRLLIGWALVVSAVAIINGWTHHRSYATARRAGKVDPDYWAKVFGRGPLLNGSVWGIGGALFYIPAAPLSSMFILLLICGVAAGSVASQASLPRALLRFLFPAILIPAARIALIGSAHSVVAFLLVVYLGFLLFVARSNHQTLIESVRLRMRNDSLLAALRESEAHFRALVENAADWVLLLKPDGTLEFQNPTGESILGYSALELAGTNAFDLVHRDDRPALRAELQRVATVGSITNSEARWRHKDGHWVSLQALGRRFGGAELVLVSARDVTERRALEAAMREARDAAEGANRVKDQFLAKMSHEMRSPLHAIKGMTELLEGTALSERQRAYVDALNEAGTRLIGIMDDLLDFSRAQSGALTLTEESLDVREIVQGVVALFSPDAQAKGIGLVADMAAGPWALRRGDSRRLRQILVNLVANAIKFTERGAVGIAVTDAATEVVLVVTDTGCGIPEDKREFVFEPFTQVEASGTRAGGGAGLGLAIARRLAELMGGEVCCESRLGEGSRFTVRLPLPMAGASAVSMPIGAATMLPPARILVVDDAEINLLVIRDYFRGTACTIAVAANGREAVAACRREPFDLVLMDLQMPEMDGREATRQIRAEERRRGRNPVPIVALTASAFEEDRRAALAAGCTDFLAKPVSKSRLFELVVKRLAARAQEWSAGLS